MTRYYRNMELYIPASLSEIHDLLGAMVLEAPAFSDDSGVFPDRNIDSRFRQLIEGFGIVRAKLDEERYAKLLDLAIRAKTMFAEDPEDNNGKTDQGREFLYEIEDILQERRAKRVQEGLPDDEGEVTGD